MTDKDFIRAFMDIKITSICHELGIDSDIKNVYNLTASKDKLKAVRNLIENKLENIYEKK